MTPWFHFAMPLPSTVRRQTDILHVRYVLALTLDTLGHSDEAQAQYREIYEADPNFKDVANRIGSVDDSPRFPASFLKSLRQNWQQFRGTAVKRPLTGEVQGRLKAEVFGTSNQELRTQNFESRPLRPRVNPSWTPP